MPQINCRPDGNVPAAPPQNRYYSSIAEGDFDFVSLTNYLKYVEIQIAIFYYLIFLLFNYC